MKQTLLRRQSATCSAGDGEQLREHQQPPHQQHVLQYARLESECASFLYIYISIYLYTFKLTLGEHTLHTVTLGVHSDSRRAHLVARRAVSYPHSHPHASTSFRCLLLRGRCSRIRHSQRLFQRQRHQIRRCM